eukprot:ANDGO_01644.mRNA.1 hypothetical protein NAEGRDRAFT_70274
MSVPITYSLDSGQPIASLRIVSPSSTSATTAKLSIEGTQTLLVPSEWSTIVVLNELLNTTVVVTLADSTAVDTRLVSLVSALLGSSDAPPAAASPTRVQVQVAPGITAAVTSSEVLLPRPADAVRLLTILLPAASALMLPPPHNESLFTWSFSLTFPDSPSTEREYDVISTAAGNTFAVSQELSSAFLAKLDADANAVSVKLSLKRSVLPAIRSQGFEDYNAARFVAAAYIPLSFLSMPGSRTFTSSKPLPFAREKPSSTGGPGSAPAGNVKPPKGCPPDLLPDSSTPADSDAFAITGTNVPSFSVLISAPLIPLPSDRPRPSAAAIAQVIPAAVDPATLIGSASAQDEFQEEVVLLARELAARLSAVDLAGDADSAKRALLREMQQTGRTVEVRERLRRVVARVVKDEMNVPPSFENEDDKARFLADVYLHVVNLLHSALSNKQHSSNKSGSGGRREGGGMVDWAQISAMYEVEGDMGSQVQFAAEQIVRFPTGTAPLVSAAYALLRADPHSIPSLPNITTAPNGSQKGIERIARAVDLLQRALALDAKCVDALCLMGLLHLEREEYRQATVLLECAVDAAASGTSASTRVDKKDVQVRTWGLLFACHEQAERSDLSSAVMRYLLPVTGASKIETLRMVVLGVLEELFDLRLLVFAERWMLSTHAVAVLTPAERALFDARLALIQDDAHRALSIAASGNTAAKASDTAPAAAAIAAIAASCLGKHAEAIASLTFAFSKMPVASPTSAGAAGCCSNFLIWRNSTVQPVSASSLYFALPGRSWALRMLMGRLLMGSGSPVHAAEVFVEMFRSVSPSADSSVQTTSSDAPTKVTGAGGAGLKWAGIALYQYCAENPSSDEYVSACRGLLDAANRFNPYDALVWLHLVLLSLRDGGAFQVADACLFQARKCLAAGSSFAVFSGVSGYMLSEQRMMTEISRLWVSEAVRKGDKDQLGTPEALVSSLGLLEGVDEAINAQVPIEQDQLAALQVLAAVRRAKGDDEQADRIDHYLDIVSRQDVIAK